MARVRYAAQARFLMTAAMAFFSIALTLHITGFSLANVRVTPLRLADLRPRAMQSYVERQFATASVPLVRYYDHLRFVYEVQARVRELRGATEGEDNGGDQKQQQPKPGETKQVPGSKDGGLHANPQRATEPAAEPVDNLGGDLVESFLEPEMEPTATLDYSLDAARQPCERSTVWIAPTIAA
jgi:hypothetical protein